MSLDWSSAPRTRRGLPWWLLSILVLVGVIGAMILGSVFRRQTVRQKMWPIVRQTAARLQTDEGALDLYRKNPDLASAYPSEPAFLDQVRAYRGKFAALPEQEPRRVPMPGTGAGPWGFRTAVQGSGAWMLLGVQAPGPLGLGGPKGEGISQLSFSDSREGLWKDARVSRLRRRQPEWDRYRAVIAALISEEGARKLYAGSPSLARGFKSERVFLDSARAWRPQLEELPQDIAATGDRLETLQVQGSPFHRRATLVYAFKTLRLEATWEDEQLSALRTAESSTEPSRDAPPAPPAPSPSAAPSAPDPRP